ncbi:helix-turn-helix transcriptional regulator [Planktotalea sp.]|uniref:helix-turn-helix transcriptional regulator n=1 Tax=Planktotalea sp. TaxID=2029877 RepID=UPI0025CC15D3|nr:helix-turn-helix transcriptional regulator [Planktotalea sp.]
MLSALDTQPSTETEAQVSALIELVGTRVRAARKSASMSRRELSERSGVSPRYLAQLESGQGNISIGLLKQVALALGVSMEALVGSNDATQRMTTLFLNADSATQAKVLQTLEPQRNKKAQRICLIGLRGAGKSTLGPMIAKDFDMPFVELNAEIAAKAGIPIGEIIALYGEEGYRQLESETLDQIVAENDRIVVAVAGGIVSSAHTFQHVLAQFHTVWIKAQPSEHMDRVRAQGDLRPMAGNPQAMQHLEQILKAREVHYTQAAYQLDTSGATIATSHALLHDLLRKNNIALTP